MKTKKLTYSALFLALGIIFPQVFHLFGGTGPIFLPMHIPVLLAGFFLGGSSGALVGFITVLISAAITGMPPVPILYFMLVEVTIYGLIAGIAYRKLKLNVYVSLILAMVVGRIALALTVFTLQPLLGLKLSPLAYMIGAVTEGLPGIIIQLVFIPIIVFSIEKAGFKFDESRAS
jgi:hypothetical protein